VENSYQKLNLTNQLPMSLPGESGPLPYFLRAETAEIQKNRAYSDN
jgi:hypothetical protein